MINDNANSSDTSILNRSIDEETVFDCPGGALYFNMQNKDADVLLSLTQEKIVKKEQEIFDNYDESRQIEENEFKQKNDEINKIVERKRKPRNGFYDVYSELKEYVGEIVDLDIDSGTFLGTFSEIKESIRQTTTFDIDQLENMSDRNSIEVGRSFLMLVGKKRKVLIDKYGEQKTLGEQNFYRITLRPEAIITPKQKKEINEISSRWRKLFAR